MIGTRDLKTWLTMCSFFLTLVSTATGATLYVNTDGSGGAYASIQAAINAANPGDQIEVAAGTYNEAIKFWGKAIRLYSSDGPTVTIIDATDLDASVVTCTNGEGAETILEGFTISGGKGTQTILGKWGGGMYNYASSPTVSNCTFSNNTLLTAGGGIANVGSSPTITDCTFSDNTAWAGGGMFNGELGDESSEPRIVNCMFSGNNAAYGGGMWNFMSNPTIINCTFSNNTGVFPGMYNEYNSNPTVTNSILWGNGLGSQIYNNPNNLESTAVVTYSDVQGGYAGTGNVDADPMFANALNGDYRLLPGSPCIDVGNNGAVPADIATDLDGNPRIVNDTVDLGAYEYPVTLVQIDVKPGSYPNAININGNGVIPVAILGSARFDVTQVVIGSLNFAGLELRVKPNGTMQCSISDVSGPAGVPDGYEDLVCQFVDDPLLWVPGGGFADLTGVFIFAGNKALPFKGSDEISIVR